MKEAPAKDDPSLCTYFSCWDKHNYPVSFSPNYLPVITFDLTLIESFKAKDHPEKPPPSIPIPGESTTREKHRHKYTCKKCGKIFDSKDALKEHMHTEHPKKFL